MLLGRVHAENCTKQKRHGQSEENLIKSDTVSEIGKQVSFWRQMRRCSVTPRLNLRSPAFGDQAERARKSITENSKILASFDSNRSTSRRNLPNHAVSGSASQIDPLSHTHSFLVVTQVFQQSERIAGKRYRNDSRLHLKLASCMRR